MPADKVFVKSSGSGRKHVVPALDERRTPVDGNTRTKRVDVVNLFVPMEFEAGGVIGEDRSINVEIGKCCKSEQQRLVAPYCSYAVRCAVDARLGGKIRTSLCTVARVLRRY